MRFLDGLAQHIEEQGIPLEQVCIVLPSQRSILYLRKSLAQRFDKPIFLPKMLTLDALARELSGFLEVDSIVASLELFQSYEALYQGSTSYQEFMGWSRSILHDFNTVDTYLIDVPQLYTDLKNLKAINEWSYLEDELGADQIAFNKFWQKLGPLYVEYNKRLDAQGLTYSGAIMRKAGEDAEHPFFGQFEKFYFAGFNALSPAEIRIIDHIHSASELSMYWDVSTFMLEDSNDPAGIFINRWKEKPWKHIFPREDQKMVDKQFLLTGHSHGLSQARWAGELLGEKDREEHHTAIVLADESLLEPLLDSFPEDFREINISIGLTIKSSVVYQVLEGYHRIHSRAVRMQEGQGRYRVLSKDLKDWVEMATSLNIFPPEVRKKLVDWMNSSRDVFLSSNKVKSIVGVDILFGPGDRNQFLDGLLEILQRIDSDEKVILDLRERIIHSLNFLRKTLERYPFMKSVDEVWYAVRLSLGRERLTYIGEPIKGLQVMGLLETRTLDFERIIMIGANEGVLPKGRSYETFLPFDLRRHYQLPTQREEDAVFAYYFFRLIQYPKEVNISYGLQYDDVGGGEKSRYLLQLRSGYLEKMGVNAQVLETEVSPQASMIGKVNTEVKQDELTRDLVKKYFTKGISFSRISDFIRCPLDFFYRSVLGLGEDRSKEEEIDSSELGKLVHDTLEELFKVHIGQGSLDQVHIKAMENKLKKVFDSMLEKNHLTEISKSGESALIKEVAYEMLQNFLKREMQRIEEDEIEVIALEENWSLEMKLDVDGEELDLRFVAKMDRVDHGREGIMLIDYKTGKVEKGKLKLKSINDEQLLDPKYSKALQLIYYSWFYWKKNGDIVDSGIISMLGMDTKPYQISIGGKDGLDDSTLMEFEEWLMDFLRDIYWRGSFVHDDEKGHYCTLCPIQADKQDW